MVRLFFGRNPMHINPLFLLILIPLYFLPAIIAISHRKKHKNSIFLVNLVFGWMVVGWVIAYVMQDYDEEMPAKWDQ